MRWKGEVFEKFRLGKQLPTNTQTLATLRETPTKFVKLLVGPTGKIPLNSKGRSGNKAKLRCAKKHEQTLLGSVQV